VGMSANPGSHIEMLLLSLKRRMSDCITIFVWLQIMSLNLIILKVTKRLYAYPAFS
jgi:accessory gene regulator protein AgrB